MNLPAGLTSKFGKQMLTLRKNSPQILFAGGITSGVASTVLACRATLKLETTLEKTRDDLAEVNKHLATIKETGQSLVNTAGEVIYTEQDAKRDAAVVYAQGVVSVGKLYAPAIGLGLLAIALLTKSQHILHERNAGLAAAYAAVDNAFSRYRERVVEEHGKEKDAEYMFGVEEVEEINPDTGRKRKVRRAGGPSMYARVFGESNPNFKDPDWNLVFLSRVERYCNDRLQATGHLFLNDAYDELGLSRTQAGSQVGWIKGEGDDYVDFGISDGVNTAPRDFITGKGGEILLDFNVDGVMWDRIDESGETNWLNND